jgi:hypothetical protein
MESILGFLSFLLLELPARAIGLFPESPLLVLAIVMAVVIILLQLTRRRRRRRR